MPDSLTPPLTTELLLRAYAAGLFPMAESAESKNLSWYDPPVRAIIPLDHRFHVPRRLRRTLRQRSYRLLLNTSFERVMRACAASATGRETTWINDDLLHLYTALHHQGHAHSIEVWDDDRLVGGLYGVSLGTAFFGESMFSLKTDASKIALVYLVALLRHCGFTLLDTQFQTDHLARFGAHEIPRATYHHLLDQAIQGPAELNIKEGDDWFQFVMNWEQAVSMG